MSLPSPKQALEPLRPLKGIGIVLLHLNGLAVTTLDFYISGVHTVIGDDTENLNVAYPLGRAQAVWTSSDFH